MSISVSVKADALIRCMIDQNYKTAAIRKAVRQNGYFVDDAYIDSMRAREVEPVAKAPSAEVPPELGREFRAVLARVGTVRARVIVDEVEASYPRGEAQRA